MPSIEHKMTSSLKKDRVKTEKLAPLGQDDEIITHTENFIRLMKVEQSRDPVEKEDQGEFIGQKRAYRRRKMSKRVTTNAS
jgi:hypothetical protein